MRHHASHQATPMPWMLVLLLCVIIAASVYAQSKALVLSQAGPLKDRIIVDRIMPDEGLICAIPKDGGLMSCRQIGELRVWIVQKPAR